MPCNRATCGSPRPTCGAPSASSRTGLGSGLRTGSGSSCAGTRPPMDVSPEHMVEQARERFQLQDYYGAIHFLEEVIASGRAFADAHHLPGLSLSLVGQPEPALAQLDRALHLNPHYVEALIHRAIVLNELGRETEADQAFRRAGQFAAERRQGFPGHVAAKLANQHAALGEAYLEAGGLAQAIAQYETALALGPSFHDLRYKLGRILLQAGRAPHPPGQVETNVRQPPAHPDAAAMPGLAGHFVCDRAADHEELGDQAYAAGAYPNALAEYQLGLKATPGRADLYAKAAAAALHTGDYGSATAHYTALAQRDRSRAGEAADGLERVVRAALQAGDPATVVAALAALRALAPGRPLR